MTTLAGSGSVGSADGSGVNASFFPPLGLAVVEGGVIYVADSGNNKIRAITPLGVVTTLAGSGTAGSADGSGTSATLSAPRYLAISRGGILYVSDTDNQKVRAITPLGVVTTLAGNVNPSGLAVDSKGVVYVAEQNNRRIRAISPAGVVSNFVRSGANTGIDGRGTSATFYNPTSLTIRPDDIIFLFDAAFSSLNYPGRVRFNYCWHYRHCLQRWPRFYREVSISPTFGRRRRRHPVHRR